MTLNRQTNRLVAALLALLVVALVAGGLVLLALNYKPGGGRSSGGNVAEVDTPLSTATVVSVVVTPLSTATVPSIAVTPSATSAPSSTAVATLPPATSTPSPLASQATGTAQATPRATSVAVSPAEQSMETLDAAKVPLRDLYSITERLKLKNGQPIPHTVDKPAGNYKVGHTETFYMSDILARRYYTITATLRAVTDHVYWYVQNGQPVDPTALTKVSQNLEQHIYPTNHQLFGSEWVPGVDNDPRFTVLFASIIGAGGYYASADEYTRAINPFSNEREIIYINSAGQLEGASGTLAHEFQHMIHWHENPGHDVWLNEGSSMLAQVVNGYDAGGVDAEFMAKPDVQLNAWQASPDAARGNYGASMLFLDYLRDHHGGDKVLRAVLAAPGQGIDAIDNALTSLGSPDHFTSVFEKWTLANLLDGTPGAADKGFDYPDRDVQVSPQAEVDGYPKSLADTVSQFGTDYIQLAPPDQGNTLEVQFSGAPQVRIIDTQPHSGQSVWWSNRGDLADTSMTRSFDLRKLSAATLQFYTWFDIEDDMDYAYVEASSDGGATWTTLKGTHTTSTNPNGNNLGNGYTARSSGRDGADQNGWLQEKVDLSAYAGKQVMLRFEYITDDGYNAGGFAVDDISIPELGYTDDAESANDGWQGQGFARVANSLPQSYYVAVVKYKQGGFDVQPVDVPASGQATFDISGLSPDGPYTKAVLVIAGTTPHTIVPASYQLDVRGK